MRPIALLAVCAALAVLSGPVGAQRSGQPAPEFPPGMATDGNKYQLADLRGKVVVLFFYESGCPSCKKTVPERSKIARTFADKPVKFIAVAAGDSVGQASGYVQETGLAMPAFADNLGLMESRYGFKISLQNIYQVRVIDPNGNIVATAMDEATLNRVIEQTKPTWKYKDKGYDAKLAPAVEAFEWGQYAAGVKLLGTSRRSPNKALAESANKLYADVKAEITKWKEEADGLAAGEPVKAYDLYQKVAAALPGDELARSASAAAGKLARDKTVAAELAARKVYNLNEAGLARLVPQQKKQAGTAFETIAKKYANTPTGDKAAALAKELAQ